MPRTLYDRPNSIDVQKGRWSLAELGLAHEYVETGRGCADGNDQP